MEPKIEDAVKTAATAVYDQIIANQQKVVDIFVGFFGEDRVDYEKPNFFSVERFVRERYPISTGRAVTDMVDYSEGAGSILVYFPKVTVTNEYNDSIEITELFVRTRVTTTGSIYDQFEMTRGEYTSAQWRAGYLHSHCSHIPEDGYFSNCCLGTGPIKHTIALLSREFDEDRWNLYCFELSEYVKVESLAGVPFNSMWNVVNNIYSPRLIPLKYNLMRWQTRHRDTTITEFWKYYIYNYPLPLNFCNGNYSLAVPPATFFKDITEKYIDWLHLDKSTLSGRRLLDYPLYKGIYVNNIFHDYTRVQPITSPSTGEGGFVCNFKGRVITRHITIPPEEQDTGRDFLLDINIINSLLTRTLFVINYGTTENSYQASEKFRVI